MTEDIINLIQELGFPIAIAIGSMGMLAWVMRYILKDKVEGTLIRFDERHDNLIKEIEEVKKEMHVRFDQERDDSEKIRKWASEIKSDLKVYVDLTMKGK